MAKKPDLGAMALPKAKAAATIPFGDPAHAAKATPPAATETALSPKSLTIKLDGHLYAALRQYCHVRELERGKRVTHQDVMVEGLRKLLGQEE